MAQASDAVWLPVLPDMKGFGPALIKGGGAGAAAGGATLGRRMGRGLLTGVSLLGAGTLAAAAGLGKIGSIWNDVENTVRRGTGATGSDLEALMGTIENAAKRTPTPIEEVGVAIADLNTRLGLSGQAAEDFAVQVLEAGRITGEALDIDQLSASFNRFGLEANEYEDALDGMFRISQATGIGMNDLSASLQRAQPIADVLGLSFDETASMIGLMDKNGINADQAMRYMSRGLVTLAKDGEPAAETFQRVTEDIQGYVDAGQTDEALALAETLFGTRGATEMKSAIESGTFAIGDFDEMLGATEDTIIGVGQETMTFSEKWQLFKNNVLVALRPIAEAVFGAIMDGMTTLTEEILPAFMAGWDGEDGPAGMFGRLGEVMRGVTDWIQDNKELVIGLAAGMVGLKIAVAAAGAAMRVYQGVMLLAKVAQAAWTIATTAGAAAVRVLGLAMRANPIGFIITVIMAVVAALVVAYNKFDWFKNFVDFVWEGIQSIVSWAWDKISGIFDSMGDGFSSLGEWFGRVSDGLREAFEGVGDKFQAVWALIDLYVLTPWRVAFALLKTMFTGDTKHIKDAFTGIKDRFLVVWNAIKSAVFDRFKSAFRAVASFFSDRADNIRNAWNVLKNKFVSVWNLIKRLVFDPFKAAFAVVKAIFSGDSEEIRRTWNNLKTKMVAIYNTIKRAVFDVFKNAFRAVANFFSDRVDNIKGYWDSLKSNLKTGYDWINRNVFQKFRDGLTWLGDRVRDAKNRIGDLWDSVKSKFATPINWVIRNVWNNGIKKVFQAVVDVIPGLDVTIPTVVPIATRAKGGYTPPGWTLVGEEGPELVNFTHPSMVYTADETQKVFAGQGSNPVQESFSAANPPHGAGPTPGTNAWFLQQASSATKKVGEWALGGLAKVAGSILRPIKRLVADAAGGGKFGELLSGTSSWAMDNVVDWLKKEDEKGIPLDTGGRSLRGAKPHVNAAAHFIADSVQPGMGMQAFNQSMKGAHGIGLAVDFLAKGSSKLQATADFMVANHQRLNGLWEVIYNHRMWTKGRGWRPLRGGMGNDPGHVWHVHGGWGAAGSYDNGGMLNPGEFAYHSPKMTKPDRVLSDNHWNALSTLAAQGGGSPDSLNVYDVNNALVGRMRVEAQGAMADASGPTERLMRQKAGR